MLYRQDIRHLGEALQKKKTWRKGMIIGGQVAELVGGGIALASPLLGPLAPEALAVGGSISGVGKLAEKLGKSRLLK